MQEPAPLWREEKKTSLEPLQLCHHHLLRDREREREREKEREEIERERERERERGSV